MRFIVCLAVVAGLGRRRATARPGERREHGAGRHDDERHDEMLQPEMLPWQERALGGSADDKVEHGGDEADKEEHQANEEGKWIVLQRVILHGSSWNSPAEQDQGKNPEPRAIVGKWI